MALTILIAALAACGLFLIAGAFLEALLPLPERAVYIVYLKGDAASAQQKVRACLRLRKRWGMKCRLLLVDCGLDAEAQTAVGMLLRRETDAALCAQSQVTEYLETESWELGAGAD